MTIRISRSATPRLAGHIFLLTVLSVFVSAAPTHAATCLERVGEIADAYAIDTDPPDLAGDGSAETMSDDLARSGGVIEPPPTGDGAVIAPPETGSAMATVPDVQPQTGTDTSATPGHLTPADTVILESLLVAARAEAERGDEQGCLERLEDAADVLRRARPG